VYEGLSGKAGAGLNSDDEVEGRSCHHVKEMYTHIVYVRTGVCCKMSLSATLVAQKFNDSMLSTFYAH
jgi:hypothetical protein